MKHLLLSLAMVVLALPAIAGGIHKWVDKDGRTHYGDKPPSQETSERVGTATKAVIVERPAPTEAELLDAIQKRDSELVSTLIREGAQVTQAALFASAKSNEAATVEILLNARETAISGISPEPAALENSMRIYQNQLMAHAVAHNADNVVRLLAQRGTNTKGGNSREPLLIKAVRQGSAPAVTALIDGGADINANEGWALRIATERGDTRMLELLLNAGADVNAGRGWALRIASERGNARIVELLLKAGADVNVSAGTRPAGPPLKDAMRRGHTEVINLLRASGATEKQQSASNK